MRLFVGIPTRGVVFTQTLKSLADNLIGFDWKLYLTQMNSIDKARNDIVGAYLASKDDFLLMLDDDEIMPENALQMMTGVNKDIVVIDAPAKRTGKSNIFFNNDGDIAASGFGCALFKRKVFEKIPAPWFDLLPRRKIEKIAGQWSFPIIDEIRPNEWGGEDINFSIKLREAGYKINTLPYICQHLEYEPFNSEKRATKILEIRKYDAITGDPM